MQPCRPCQREYRRAGLVCAIYAHVKTQHRAHRMLADQSRLKQFQPRKLPRVEGNAAGLRDYSPCRNSDYEADAQAQLVRVCKMKAHSHTPLLAKILVGFYTRQRRKHPDNDDLAISTENATARYKQPSLISAMTLPKLCANLVTLTCFVYYIAVYNHTF